MSVFVDYSSIRFEEIYSSFFYFDDKGVLYRGVGSRSFRTEFSSAKVRCVLMKSVERVLFVRERQSEAVKRLALSYGLPVLPNESREERKARYLKNEAPKRRGVKE